MARAGWEELGHTFNSVTKLQGPVLTDRQQRDTSNTQMLSSQGEQANMSYL